MLRGPGYWRRAGTGDSGHAGWAAGSNNRLVARDRWRVREWGEPGPVPELARVSLATPLLRRDSRRAETPCSNKSTHCSAKLHDRDGSGGRPSSLLFLLQIVYSGGPVVAALPEAGRKDSGVAVGTSGLILADERAEYAQRGEELGAGG